VSLYFVRHAKAGSRSDWAEDDLDRPLSKSGWKQAEALADRLAKRGITALVTSPYLRCRQTLEPLAARLDLPIATDHRLTEGERFEAALALMAELPDGAVLCSHGDLIPDTIQALERRGCTIATAPDWRKATVWVLERDADGAITDAKVWPPPS
jgi:8-oxo-dGTP diphosphatase